MAIPGPLPQTPAAQSFFSLNHPEIEVPIIDKDEHFRDVVQKISKYVTPERILVTSDTLSATLAKPSTRATVMSRYVHLELVND